MKVLLAAALALSMSGGLLSDDTTLGAGVTLKDATPIPFIVKKPQDYVGKTVRIDGVATAVCEEMGCWMAVADSAKKNAPTIRLKVEHEGAIVFPMSAKGKHVSAEGVFESSAATTPTARKPRTSTPRRTPGLRPRSRSRPPER